MLLLAFSLPATLTACNSSQGLAPTLAAPQLVPIPTNLSTRCADPGVRAGKDARLELARNRAWGKCERRRADDAVSFYNDQRSGLAAAARR